MGDEEKNFSSTSTIERIRRLVAQGQDPLEAALNEADALEGPVAKIENWLKIDAQNRGLNPKIAALLEDDTVSDILINSNKCWVDRSNGLEEVDLDIQTEEDARNLASRLAAAAGRRLDDASPIFDGTLPDGIRIHAVIPPIGGEGTLISLRIHKKNHLSLAQLTEKSGLGQMGKEIFTKLVANGASIIISGPTGSGKTTLLAALLSEVPTNQRIVCIEEAMEIAPEHPHVVHLQQRQSNIEGEGAVSLSALVKAAMRMRPDRLVLGECRGSEVREVLTALNTGHQGGMATIHANSAQDVPARLIALGSLAKLSPGAVGSLSCAALDAVIQMSRTTKGRSISSIGVLFNHNSILTCRKIIEFSPHNKTNGSNYDTSHESKDSSKEKDGVVRRQISPTHDILLFDGAQDFIRKWKIGR